MAPCLICYFIVILFYIEIKWLLMGHLARILPSKSKMSEKFHCFNAIYGIIKMLKNSWIYKNFYEAQKFLRTALMKLFSFPSTHPPSDKILLRLSVRRYTKINGHLLSKCFKNAVLGVKKRWSANVFFWHQTETCLLENFY